MRSCAWLAILLSTFFVLAACEREKKEEVPPRQTETAPPPVQEEMEAPAESERMEPGETERLGTDEEGTSEAGTGEEYVTPREGERTRMEDLEVVDKNISVATDQPSVIETPEGGSGAETVVFEAKNGNVTFNHRAHGEREDCATCHEQTPPQKIELDQQSAHALCRGCHQDRGMGPVKCTECHKKE